jgi:hypothetical protein
MNRTEWRKLVGVAGRMLLAFAFVFSQTAWAGQDQKSKHTADSPQKSTVQQTGEKPSSAATTAKAQSQEVKGETSESAVAEEKPSRDGSHEGIKVHGHWTIEVRDPDGTVVTHREFENSYYSVGGLLPSLLARKNSLGGWAIWMNVAGGRAIFIVEPIVPGSATGASANNNLTVTPTPSGQIILAGSGPALDAGNITLVATLNWLCAADVSPTNCYAATANATISTPGLTNFSGTTLSTSVPVLPGQIVQATVTLSFS